MRIVTKRNGDQQPFDFNKIEKAVRSAFLSIEPKYQNKEDSISFVLNVIEHKLDTLFSENNNHTVEEIQNVVECSLMKCEFFDVAREYILYREKHNEIRNFVQKKKDFISNYIKSDNTANATIDDNSNVANHNIAVLNSEIHKSDNQEVNIRMLEDKVRELYPDFDYKQLKKDLNTIAYLHDSSSQIGMPYCVAISMYPFLLNGIKELGGLSAKPKNLDSFCGMFVNLVFAVASQFKGAVATPGMLLCMDYFCRKEWGDDYYLNKDLIISAPGIKVKTIQSQVHQYFQQICYSLMQPSAARGNQSVFWNLSLFDKPFFDTMYGDFRFPDGSPAKWESLCWLQKDFLHWFNQERLKCILTFPVVSVCLINQDNKFLDKDLYEFTCQEYAEGNSFFTYISDSADSLSSCCRLSSKIEKPQFNFTNGQLSEMTGSKNVITLNLNRIIQDWCKSIGGVPTVGNQYDSLKFYLIDILERIYKYQTAYNALLTDLYNNNLLSVYKAGFISMKKQYLTIGINGLSDLALIA